MATDPASTPRRNRPWRRRALVAGAVLATAAAAGLAWLLLADLGPLATRLARSRLDRDVTIGSARLTAGQPLGLTLTDLRVANPSWARDPDFLRADRVTLQLELTRLIAGEILLPAVAVEGLQVSLEHGPQGQGNWKPLARPAAAPADPGRPWLPTILSLELRRARLLVHTTAGSDLTIATIAATLRTQAPDAPVTLDAPLSYNGAPIALQATMDSFDAYRQPDRRFAFRAAATADGGRLDLDGTADQPLAFDGVTGRLHADLTHIGRFAAIFGTALPTALAADVTGAFTHQDRTWQIDQATGQLAGSDLTGQVTLTEGPHGQPDSLAANLAVARLDLATILDPSGPPDATPAKLAVSDNPGTRLDARLAVADLRWAARSVTDFRVHATIQPRRIGLDDIAFTTDGGQLTGSLHATAAANPAEPPLLSLRADLAHADAAGLLRLAGLRSRVVTGPIDARASLDAQAATLPQLQSAATGQIILAMRSGRISRDLMALAATDIGLLLTDTGGTTNLACLLAVLDLREGFGVLSPVRLRSGEGTISGGGVLDLARRSLDLSFRTDRDTTSLLALDVPVRITGPFAAPAIRPALTSDAAAIANQGAIAATRLPPPIRSLATDSRCLH